MTEYLNGFGTFAGFATVLLLAIVGVAMIFQLARCVTSARLAPMILMAVAIDVGILLTLLAVSGRLSGDAVTWHSLASQAAAYLTGQTGEAVAYVTGKEGYVWIVGGLYALSGPVPLVAVTLGILCHLAVVVSVAKSTELLLESAAAVGAGVAVAVRRSAFLAAALPAIVWWVPHVLRESMTFMLFSGTLCFVLLALVRKSVWPLFFAVAAIAILSWVRGSLGLILALATLAAVVYILVGRNHYRLALRGALILGVLVLFPTLQVTLAEALNVSEQSIAGTTAELSAIAASGFPGLGSGLDIVQVLSITAPRVLIGPFVWEFSASAAMMLAFVELLCWLLVVILALRSAKLFRQGGALSGARWLLPAVLVIVAIVLIGLTLVVGNYGILARFRPIASVLLIPLAGIGATRAAFMLGALRAKARTGRVAG